MKNKRIVVYRCNSFLIIDMIREGKVEQLKRLSHYNLQHPLIIAEAAYYGRIDIMEILLSKRCAINFWVCHHAIRSGNQEVITFLKERGLWDKYYKDAPDKSDFNIQYDSEED